MLLPHNSDHQDQNPGAKRHKVHITEEILAWQGVGCLGDNMLCCMLERKIVVIIQQPFWRAKFQSPPVLGGRGPQIFTSQSQQFKEVHSWMKGCFSSPLST